MRFITGDAQIRLRFGMVRIERESAFVIENCMAEIFRSKVSIAEIVKKIRRILAGAHYRFVIFNRGFELATREFLIRLDELLACLCECE